MAITEAAFKAWTFDILPVRVTSRDAILFGLSLGQGADPTDLNQLRHVYENGLIPHPMMPIVLGSPGMWFGHVGLDAPKVLYGSLELEIFSQLPLDTDLLATNRIGDLVDRGTCRGAMFEVVRQIETVSGMPVARVSSTYMAMGDGGFGGSKTPVAKSSFVRPERAPDILTSFKTLPQSALIYRLNGDINPLHADPSAAIDSGFARPILHGQCTLGHSICSILDKVAGGDALRLKSVSARMTSPVYPGEPLSVAIWQTLDRYMFEVTASDRGVRVLSNGVMTLAE